MATFDSGTLELIRVFEARTGAHANDVIIDEEKILFLVQEGEIGKAIGKEGSNLARLRVALRPKQVEVVEDSADPRGLTEKILRGVKIKSIAVEENPAKVVVSVDSASRGLAIGRNGATLKKLRLLLKKRFAIEEVRIV